MRALVVDATTTDLAEDPDFTQNPTQNATDNLIGQSFFILDEDLGSDTDEDESDYKKETVDVKTDADIFMFSQILAEVQLAAVKAEQEAAQEQPNCKQHYSGNAPWTKCYHAQKRRKLAKTGQKFIQSFFMEKPEL